LKPEDQVPTKIKIGKEKKAIFMKQLQRDIEFLTKLEIMDYSLLLGRHDRKKSTAPTMYSNGGSGAEGKISRSDTPLRRNRRQEGAFDFADSGSGTGNEGAGMGVTPAAAASRQISQEPLRNVPEDEILGENGRDSTGGRDSEDEGTIYETEDESEFEAYGSEEEESGNESFDERKSDGAPSPMKPAKLASALQRVGTTMTEDEKEAVNAMKDGVHTAPNPWTSRADGGMESENRQEIYFCGIIDILQQYNTRKRAETFFKGFSANNKQISCVHPEWYGDRFLQFMDNAFE
jgi:hypothetical protein